MCVRFLVLCCIYMCREQCALAIIDGDPIATIGFAFGVALLVFATSKLNK